MEADFKSYSKADILKWLRMRLKHSVVEDLFIFTVQEWQESRDTIFKRIKDKFSSRLIVVRSSSSQEDGFQNSQAGYFHSELGVETSDNAIGEAINKVITSYSRLDLPLAENKILIQPHTKDISISGVIFTRQIQTNAPYYVINYDDKTGKTDTVTSGVEGNTVYISRFKKISVSNRWYNLIKAVTEIESLFVGQVLDIEFAITKNNQIVIFQVRHLAANHSIAMPNDSFVRYLIEDMADKFERFSRPVPHLGGSTTIFGDMPDWNPSEIIGSRPNTLDYTLYSFIITDSIWHEARSSLGYYDVFPAELMVSFAKKPYIDVRASFNSLTPAGISHQLREKLVNYYLQKLKDNPANQDKVEFEVLWTCCDFSTKNELEKLIGHGFSQDEIDQLFSSLLNLTNNILTSSRDIIREDTKQVEFLTQRRDLIIQFYLSRKKTPWSSLYTAYNLLQNCKKFGTLPFSRQARLAFIAKSFLVSLRKRRIISSEIYHSFLNSIRTVASNFSDDLVLLQNNQLDRKSFLKRYGHLRAGTYDITVPRYDQAEYLFENNNQIVYRRSDEFITGMLPDSVLKEINQALKEESIIYRADNLLMVMKLAIENRERAKFEFTKSLSDAIELIAQAGEYLGFNRSELCHCDFNTIMKFRNPEHGDEAYAKKTIQYSIDRHKIERHWYDAAILGPVITSEEDFYYIAPYKSRPNFITQKSVSGKIVTFDQIKQGANVILRDKVVLLENADPGFDWIFAKKPLGIITKYGGVASHMSIRCAEFNIPAAIGAGVIYDSLKGIKAVRLDCEKETIQPIRDY